MLDLKWIREQPADFDQGLKRRGLEPLSAAVLKLDEERRANTTALQELQQRRNALSKEIGKAKGKAKGSPSVEADAMMAEVAGLKDRMTAAEEAERRLDDELKNLLAGIPNIPLPDVPDGKDEHDNVKVREWGKPRDFSGDGFEPKQHFEIGEAMGLMDFEAAAKMSGARFTVLKGPLARLERAIGQFMLDLQTGEHGYTEVNPPLLVKDDAVFGTAQLPKFADDLFSTLTLSPNRIDERNIAIKRAYLKGLVENFIVSNQEYLSQRAIDNRAGLDDLLAKFIAEKQASELSVFDDPAVKESVLESSRRWLIPTAEVPMTNLVRESIVPEAELPYRFTALTPCFRAEAGAAGKDTRGMIRQHQFNKVELVSIATPDQAIAEHERMTSCAEEVLKRLELPYRTMVLCTGDMGFASRKTYDIEVWLPGQGTYREISSCSVCGDFQARRMNARFRPKEGKDLQFVHTLNGSGLAVGRTLIAVMENYQQKDGSVRVPDVLKRYMGGAERVG